MARTVDETRKKIEAVSESRIICFICSINRSLSVDGNDCFLEHDQKLIFYRHIFFITFILISSH